jgi:hypothetical protein
MLRLRHLSIFRSISRSGPVRRLAVALVPEFVSGMPGIVNVQVWCADQAAVRLVG